MKKNYKQNIEQGIKKISLLSSTIIILIVTIVIGTVLIRTEYTNFKNHIKNFEQTLIEREKFYIKTSVENLRQDIEFEENTIYTNIKQRIKNQSIIAYNLAYSLYKETKNLSKEQQIKFIKSSLKQISNTKDDINYFILDTKGNLLLNSEHSQDENKNFLEFADINNFKFINYMIDSPKDKQNFVEYSWYKPNSYMSAKKISYVKHLEELDIIIGSGTFFKLKKENLRKNIIKKILAENYTQDQFVLLYDIKSLNDIEKKSTLISSKHIKPTSSELESMQSLMIDTNYKGNDYIFYENNRKIFYASFLKNQRYFIAVGSKLSNIYSIIEKERQVSLENLYNKIFKVLLIMMGMAIIFFILSLIFTKKIENLFSRYRNIVKKNEEKYALLFNYSNDAFIISSINDTKTDIYSLNNTALETIGYETKEILYTEFFDLFEDFTLSEIQEMGSISKTVTLLTKNKEIRTVEINAIIYSDDKKKLLFASLRDITERTLLKEERVKQQKILIQKSKMAAMGEMIGNIAHQWRQPLSQISGLFFDIESAYDYKELDKKYLTKTVDEANDLLEYMSKTIDDFRNFFNPDSKKENFVISDAISNAKKILNSSLIHHKIDIQTSCPSHYEIHGYKNEYTQAIVNIISNAKDTFIERDIKNPKIKIYIEDKDSPIVYIEDNAGGIDSKIKDKIFDPYFTTKYEYGTGIGLYMTKIIIEEKMNGNISVENKNDGALFSIKI